MKFFIEESRHGFVIKSEPTERYPDGIFVEGFYADEDEAKRRLAVLEEANR